MAKFVLTAQLQLQAPTNTSSVINDIRRQLQGISVPIEIKNASTANQQINQITDSTRKATSAAEAMGRSFGLAIKRFAAFTIASRAVSLFTNSLANAIDDAIVFERELVRVAQVTGKSVSELQDLTDTIQKLSTGLGTSSKDLLSTATILAQAGIVADDLKVALDALAKTTLAPNFDSITETAEGAVAILAQFGEGVNALERQLGSVNSVAGAFAVEAEDLIGAVRRFGGVFKASGGSLEELLAIFTSVRATTRESAESISTGLRTIFTRIQRPKTIEFLRQFGVELLDLEGKFVGPFEASKRLSEALSGLEEGDVRFIRVAEELGGFRQIGKVIPLLQQFSLAQNALNVAQEGGNSLSQDAATAQQALAIQITKVKEEFFALVRGISESKSFQLFARTALEIASALIKVADAIKPLLPLLATLFAFKFAQGLGNFAASAGAAIRGLGTLGQAQTRRNRGGEILAFARGGFVPGVGNSDSVPAMLTPGEFVIRKSSVNKIGADKLAAMNENKYQKGGKIKIQEGKIGAFFLNPEKGKRDRQVDEKVKITNLTALNRLGADVALDDKTRKEVFVNLSKKDQEKIAGSELNNKINKDYFQKGKFEFLAARTINSNGIGYIQPDQIKEIQNNTKLLDKIIIKSFSKTQPTTVEPRDVKMEGLIRGFFPGGSIPKTAELSVLIDNTVSKLLKQGVETASPIFDKALSIPPQLDLNEKNIAKAAKKLSEDKNAIKSVGGFLFEGIVSAITGATLAGNQENFDFPNLNKARKDQLIRLFSSSMSDPAQGIETLIKAEAKRTGSSKAMDEIVKKLTNDINRGIFLGIEFEKKALGGNISGSDTVPALLTPGEFVVNKKSAQSIGYNNLNRMNKQGVTGFAKGGPVGFYFGGRAARKNVSASFDREQVSAVVNSMSQVDVVLKQFINSIKTLPPAVKQTVDKVKSVELTKDKKYDTTVGTLRGDELNGLSFGGKVGINLKGGGNTFTVKHEASHEIDRALVGGKGKGFASLTEGTFQNKVAKELLKSYSKEAGLSEYRANLAEIWADAMAKVPPEVRNILASTTDAKKGSKLLAEYFNKAGGPVAGLADLSADEFGGKQEKKKRGGFFGLFRRKDKPEQAPPQPTPPGSQVQGPPKPPQATLNPTKEQYEQAKKDIKSSAATIKNQQQIKTGAESQLGIVERRLTTEKQTLQKTSSSRDELLESKKRKEDFVNRAEMKLQGKEKIARENIQKQENIVKKSGAQVAGANAQLTSQQTIKSQAEARVRDLIKAQTEQATRMAPQGTDPSQYNKAQKQAADRFAIIGKQLAIQEKLISDSDKSIKGLNASRVKYQKTIDEANVAIDKEKGGLTKLDEIRKQNIAKLKQFDQAIKKEEDAVKKSADNISTLEKTRDKYKNTIENANRLTQEANRKITTSKEVIKNFDKNQNNQGNQGGNLTAGLVAISLVSGALEYLKPKITETSSAFAKFSAGLISKFQALLLVVSGLIGTLTALGIQLKASDIKGFLLGKTDNPLSQKIQSGVFSGVEKLGASLSKLPGPFGSLGGVVTSLAPKLSQVAAASGPLIAAFAAGITVMIGLNKAVDAVTKIHERYKKAIETGNVEQAGELGVQSANAKVASSLAVGVTAITTAIGAIIGGVLGGPPGAALGAAIGAFVGVIAGFIIKMAQVIGLLDPIINALRDTIGVFLGFASTDTVRQEGRLAAARNKAELEAATNARAMSEALKRVESGLSSLSRELEQGNLTRQLSNDLLVLTESFKTAQSKIKDINNSLFGQLESSTGLFRQANQLDRATALQETAKEQAAFTQRFATEVVPQLGRVAAEQVFLGSNAQQAQDFVKRDAGFRAATEQSVFSPEDIVRIEQNRKKDRATLSAPEQAEIKIREFELERARIAEQQLKIDAERAVKQKALIEAINFGLGALADQLTATNKRLTKLLTIDQIGDQFTDSLDVLQIALSSAANSLTENELDGAISTLQNTLIEAGASDTAAAAAADAARGFQTAFSRLNEGSESFKNIQSRLAQASTSGQFNAINTGDIIADELTRGLPAEVADRIRKGIEEASDKLRPEDISLIAAGNFTPLREALKKSSDAFNAEILSVLQKRAEAEQALIKGIQQRIAAEQEYVAAQKRASELQLEAGRIIEEFGGKLISSAEKRQVRLSGFNAGAEFLGIGGLSTGNASEIQSRAAEIGSRFFDLESRARTGAAIGERAFSGAAGAEEDTRERLKLLQQELINQTKLEIEARKEELQLIQKKNQAEKDALDKLLAGDVEGFLQGQAAASAGAALATGNQALTGLFSAGALGAGFKTLEGQRLSNEQRRRAENLTLSRFGIESTGVLSGTTNEELALKNEIVALGGALGTLAQQAAEFERMEITTKQAIVNAQRVEVANLGNELDRAALGQGASPLARGGIVYASRGVFVPRGTDTVPAMLTPGEFVVNRSAVQRGNNLQILQAMNNGGGASAPGAMRGGGQVKYYNLGGIVDGISNAFNIALPQLTTAFTNFSSAVDKLIGFKFNVTLDTTNVNVNFNGASFLSTLREEIGNQVLDMVAAEIPKYKSNSSGDLVKTTSLV